MIPAKDFAYWDEGSLFRIVQIALTPLYVDYYESVVPGIRKSKDRLVAKTLAAIGPNHKVLVAPYVTDSLSATAARNWLRRERPDCLVVLPLVATFSHLSDEVVREWKGPLVLLSAMAGTSCSRPITMAKVVAQSQAFGTQAIANGWMRNGHRFHVIHQILGSPQGNNVLRDLLNVIAASTQLSRLRIGLIGQPFANMTDIELPAAKFASLTGARIISIGMRRVHYAMRNVSRTELAALSRKLSTIFVVERFSAQERNFCSGRSRHSENRERGETGVRRF